MSDENGKLGESPAKTGLAVATGITTLVVAAGLFAGGADRTHLARYLAAGTLALWLVAMFLFLLAGTTLTRSFELLPAVFVAGVATIFTITVFALITSTSLGVDTDKGLLRLTHLGHQALGPLCPKLKSGPLLPGTLDVPSLKSQYVVFVVKAGYCHKTEITLKIRRADVAAFAEDAKLQDGTDKVVNK